MSRISHEELEARLAEGRAAVEVGAYYCHYKNPHKRYQVVDLAVLEATDEVAVLYRITDGATPDLIWVRPLSSFLDAVEHEGQTVPRFTKAGTSDLEPAEEERS